MHQSCGHQLQPHAGMLPWGHRQWGRAGGGGSVGKCRALNGGTPTARLLPGKVLSIGLTLALSVIWVLLVFRLPHPTEGMSQCLAQHGTAPLRPHSPPEPNAAPRPPRGDGSGGTGTCGSQRGGRWLAAPLPGCEIRQEGRGEHSAHPKSPSAFPKPTAPARSTLILEPGIRFSGCPLPPEAPQLTSLPAAPSPPTLIPIPAPSRRPRPRTRPAARPAARPAQLPPLLRRRGAHPCARPAPLPAPGPPPGAAPAPVPHYASG